MHPMHTYRTTLASILVVHHARSVALNMMYVAFWLLGLWFCMAMILRLLLSIATLFTNHDLTSITGIWRFCVASVAAHNELHCIK